MARRPVIAAAFAAALTAVAACPDAPVAAGAGRPARDALTVAASEALASFRSSARKDDLLHASALRTLTADLRAERTAPDETFAVHASALAYLVEKLDAAADDAAAGFLDAATVAMSGDASLPGAVPGGGGSADRFVEGVRAELERVRRRTDVRLRRFARTFAANAGARATMNASLPQWAFDLPAAPSPKGPISVGDEPPRIRALTATRLTDGRVFFAAAGTAGPAYAHEFDLRLRGEGVDLVGDDLANGGIDVTAGGAWEVFAELGDPFEATVPLPGNRVVHLGVEPYDAGAAGRQPGRLLKAAVFGLP